MGIMMLKKIVLFFGMMRFNKKYQNDNLDKDEIFFFNQQYLGKDIGTYCVC